MVMRRELRERALDGAGVTGARARRSVTVNVAESPLSWLRARDMIDARQFEAGERLREDYEAAALGARVTMSWTAVPVAARRGGAIAEQVGGTALAAKRRFDAAVATLGGGLADIAWRVICAGDALPVAEEALGWPKRSGRVVLTLALDRLADHYRLP